MSGADLAAEYTTDDEAFRKENPMAEFLRMDRMPHIWCPGCGIGTVVTCFAEAIKAGGYDMDKIAVVSGIGCTGRVAGYVKFDSFHTTHGRAIQQARKAGIKVGMLRLITVWPFCETKIRNLARKVKAIVVPELNYGQIVLEVERCAAGQCKVISVNSCGGAVHDPEEILAAIKEGAK